MITSGGIVIMNGSGRTVVGAQSFERLGTAAFAARLAEAAGLALAEKPDYFFLYPSGYDVLLGATFPLPARYGEIRANAVFGDGTKLYNALANLSQALGVTLVADQIVGEVSVGETVLRDVPLTAALEALLRSARATPDAVIVEAAGDHVFVRAANNPSPPENLLNAAELAPADRAALDRVVSLVLPEAARRPDAAVFVGEAMGLSSVLESMSRQLGIAIAAAPGLENLPVNYMVLNEMPLGTALDLFVRQWPLAKFGYEFRAGAVTIRPR